MAKKEKYVIVDWANNLKAGGETFNTFEDAWDWIDVNVAEEDQEEFYAVLESEA